jgi:hypothetical protein
MFGLGPMELMIVGGIAVLLLDAPAHEKTLPS